MRFRIIFSLAVLFSYPAFAQPSLELETGGSNFIGSTINATYGIKLGSTGNHIITPKFGVGLMWAWWDDNPFIAQLGVNYNFKRFGIGASTSHFYSNPYWGEFYPHGFVDMIVYPNISYILLNQNSWYLKLSGGAYFAFSISGSSFVDQPRTLYFEGDVIPGGGLIIGHSFN